mgnify:CR=1 FL=1
MLEVLIPALIILIGLSLLKVPIYISVFCSAIYLQLFVNHMSLSSLFTGFFEAMTKNSLLAVPFFMVAGSIIAASSLGTRLINVCIELLKSVRGGLPIACVIANAIFGAISGSGPAATATFGKVAFKPLSDHHGESMALGIITSSACLSTIIPPSITMIIYGVVANTSILGLFKAIWDGKWALATPVIILGGIYCGVFTPTEAAEVGVLWTLFVGLFVYRKLTWKNISSALIRTSAFAGSATILVGVSMAFSRLLTLYHIPQTVGAFLGSISTDPTITLLLIAFFIFLCGFVADTLAMVVVLAPVFLPITNALGIHPIQLGVLFVVCCETGFLTPPFGANLFITMKITDVKLEEVTPESFSNADVVFLGYPIWWGEAAWPVNEFVKENDFTGKTVIPFCTSASSSLGDSGENLAEMAGTGEWQEGKRFSSGAAEEEIRNWIGSLDLSAK